MMKKGFRAAAGAVYDGLWASAENSTRKTF